MGLFKWFGLARKKTAATHDLQQRSQPPLGAQPLFHIRYREDFGANTRRDIFPIRMYAVEEGVRAWDYLIGEIRLFKFSQMLGVHDNRAGRDIKVRGLWKWCGLPDTDQTFPDEEPGVMKQTEWQKNPDAARFKFTLNHRGASPQVVDFSPRAWATHRRSMFGVVFPSAEEMEIPFTDVLTAIDLKTGEVLNRIELWNLVLAHRDDAVPWYVQFADQHLMVLCLVGFARQEFGKFASSMRLQVNAALQEAGYPPLDDTGFKSVIQAMREGFNGRMTLVDQVPLLTAVERDACRACAVSLLVVKGLDAAKAEATFSI